MIRTLVGNQLRLSVTFTDPFQDNAPVDPDDVYLAWQDPQGNYTQKQYNAGQGDIVRDATGQYHYDLDVSEAGLWLVRWWSTGTAKAAEETSFYADAVGVSQG